MRSPPLLTHLRNNKNTWEVIEHAQQPEMNPRGTFWFATIALNYFTLSFQEVSNRAVLSHTNNMSIYFASGILGGIQHLHLEIVQ